MDSLITPEGAVRLSIPMSTVISYISEMIINDFSVSDPLTDYSVVVELKYFIVEGQNHGIG